jgi:ATP-dependent protease ClpP protease subunit
MSFYTITNLSKGAGDHDPQVVSINMHGPIGDDYWDDGAVGANQFINTVESFGSIDIIRISLASPGGNFFDGLMIANYLKAHSATVEITILSEASSAASMVAMGASKGQLKAFKASFMMIHDPSTWGGGNSTEFRRIAVVLDTLKSGMLSLYTSRTGKTEDEIWALMLAETLMTADQSLLENFIDEIIETDMPVVNISMSRDKAKAGAILAAKTIKIKPKPEPATPAAETNAAIQIIEMCDSAGVSFLAAGFVKNNASVEGVKKIITQASSLKDVCAAGGIACIADELIKNMSNPAEMVKLAIVQAQADGDTDIDGGLQDEQEPKKTTGKTTADIYQKRRNQGKL